jgi:hypothetical protein
MFEKAWIEMDAARIRPSAWVVRGTADLQLSTDHQHSGRSGVEVMVHAYVRAQYVPDDGTATVPAPIHGEIRAIYTVKPRTLPDGRKVLRYGLRGRQPPSVHRSRRTGLTAGDVDTIAAQMRGLAEPVRASRRGASGTSPSRVQTLGPVGGKLSSSLQLSGAPLPATGIWVYEPVHRLQRICDCGQQGYVQTFLDAMIASIRLPPVTIITATYTGSVSAISLTGRREQSACGQHQLPYGLARSRCLILVHKAMTVVLDVPTQTVAQAVGDPDVDEPWWFRTHWRCKL